MDANGQRPDATDEVGVEPGRLADDVNFKPALQDFLPEDLQLQFGEPIADATMNTGPERQVLARLGTIDDETVGRLDRILVAVARDIPHDDLIALGDRFAAELRRRGGRAPHMDDGGLISDDFGHQF